MTLRKHQQQVSDIADDIIAGSPVKTIIPYVEPGAGKSLLPVILASKLIREKMASAICWVVPRKNLQHQAASNFIDPYFRQMLGHDSRIRESTNDANPCRGLSGFVTTYQAIGIDENQSVLFEFMQKRMILVLDEFHHVEQGGIWHKALTPILEKAAYSILFKGSSE